MVILYRSENDILNSWAQHGVGERWGNLNVIYDVEDTMHYLGTENSGIPIASQSCLGKSVKKTV